MTPSQIDRFNNSWVQEPNSGCWLWMAKVSDKGYGLLRSGHKWLRAHRVSWLLHKGEIQHGAHVLHKCDTPSCINPSHLWTGTHSDNMADMARKGRVRHGDRLGEKNKLALLTDEDVRNIRRAPPRQTKWLATMHGVSESIIYKVRSGVSWSHVK